MTKQIPPLILSMALVMMPVQLQAGESSETNTNLINRIVGNSISRANVEEIDRAFADTVARPIFKNLRADNSWTPENPLWNRMLPEFSEELYRLTKELVPDLEGRLKVALQKSLTLSELSEIAERLDDPAYKETRSFLEKAGLDDASTVRLMGMASAPSLYSRSEQDTLKKKLMSLQSQQKEMEALKSRLEPTLKAMQSPAFSRYQKALVEVLSETSRRLAKDGQGEQRMKSFFTRWQEVVQRESASQTAAASIQPTSGDAISQITGLMYLRGMSVNCPFPKTVADGFEIIAMVVASQIPPVGKDEISAAGKTVQARINRELQTSKGQSCQKAVQSVEQMADRLAKSQKANPNQKGAGRDSAL